MPLAVFKTVGFMVCHGTVGSIPAHFRHSRGALFVASFERGTAHAFFECPGEIDQTDAVSAAGRRCVDVRLWKEGATVTDSEGTSHPERGRVPVSLLPEVHLCLATSLDGRIAEDERR